MNNSVQFQTAYFADIINLKYMIATDLEKPRNM